VSRTKTLGLVLFIFILIISPSCQKGEKPGVQSVILITIDTLRFDHLPSYGYLCPTTPQLDGFIQRGTRFDHAISSAPNTTAALSSVLVGLYPSFHSAGVANGTYVLGPEYTTLAELCQARGMKTAAIVSNPTLTKKSGLYQGFQSYDDEFYQKELSRDFFEQTADRAVDKAMKKLAELEGQAFFFWLHLQDPHGPYLPHVGIDRLSSCGQAGSWASAKFLPLGKDDFAFGQIPRYQNYHDRVECGDYIRRYDEEVAYTDDRLKRFLDEIVRRQLLKNTLVILMADHGEALGEEEFYFGHGHSVSLDQIRVPLAFIGPGIPEGQIIRTAGASTLDIFSSILDFLDIPIPARVHSVSLRSRLMYQPNKASRPLFVESPSQRGVLNGLAFYRSDRIELEEGYYFIDSEGRSGEKCVRLGDQCIDLKSLKELQSEQESREAKNLLREFTARAEKALAKIKKTRVKVKYENKEELEKLKSLGYIMR
jgi:hypothetical protein